jgi:hypothetical protein
MDRRTIRVRAFLSEQIPGRTVYFRNFDLDDPSDDPIIDPNGDNGDDNNGTVAGGTTAGLLSSVDATTNAQGMATVNFTVTKQPGDNFAIVAGTNQEEVANVTMVGTDLRTGAGVLIETNCDGTSSICRSEMLTVWRRLHIEVDSMGVVDGNHILGTTQLGTREITINPGQSGNVTVIPSPNVDLEINRFENGRFVVVGTGASLFVVSNTTNTLEVTNQSGSPVTVPNAVQFNLYDDDNMDDGVGPLNGDAGEDVPMPHTSMMQSSDNPDDNRFAPAYIRPVYDIGDNNENTNFAVNVREHSGEAIRELFDFDQVATEDSEDFWTVYLLGAYQYTTELDGDPDEEDPNDPDDYGWVGVADEQNGQGALILFEPHRIGDCHFGPIFCNIPGTAVHEIGHLLNADHDDGGIMATESLVFSAQSIARMRAVLHP